MGRAGKEDAIVHDHREGGEPLLLRDARFYGGDVRHDILIRGGRVAAIGPAGSRPAAGETDRAGAEPVELDGRFVGPGLWDEHVHFTQWVIRRQRFDLGAAASAAQALDVVREQVRQHAHGAGDPARPILTEPILTGPTLTGPILTGPILTGYGFRDGLWPDSPSRSALDAATPGVPVVLISGDLHCAWLNSLAAHRLGLELDASGLVREGPWMAAARTLNPAGSLPLAAYHDAAAAAAARGVVGIAEYESADNVVEWPQRAAAGVRSLRVEASIWPDRLDDAISRGLRTGDVLDGDGLITVGRLKVIVDGSLNTRTAWCWDPYPGLDPHAPDACGVAVVALPQLRTLLEQAQAHGISAAVHAIGDRANAGVIDTYAELGMSGTIEHAQLVSPRDVARFGPLGLIASVQPEHAMDDRDIADRHWAGRTDRAFAFGSLHAAGATLRLGSDAPVAPLDPWQAIAAAATRSRDHREPWHPEQRLPLDVALAASARGRRRVSVGDEADLVVLDRDPLSSSHPGAVSGDELRAMPVAGTLLGGRWTFSALG